MNLLLGTLLIGQLWMNSPGYVQSAVNTPDAEASATVSKTSLVAWYDMADNTDSHGSYTLVEDGTPSYDTNPTRGIADDVGPNNWYQNTLDDTWLGTDQDATLAIRFQLYGSIATGDWIYYSHSGEAYIRNNNPVAVSLGNIALTTSLTSSTGVWYLFIMEYDSATDSIDLWINNGTVQEASGTYADAADQTYIGGGANGEDIEVDYVGFWNRKLTSDERTAIYNSGGTFNYSDMGD